MEDLLHLLLEALHQLIQVQNIIQKLQQNKEEPSTVIISLTSANVCSRREPGRHVDSNTRQAQFARVEWQAKEANVCIHTLMWEE
jgi:hypothetical protein